MKKILFLISNLGGGGAEKVLTTYVKFLKAKYCITVQTLFDEGVYRAEIMDTVNYSAVLKKPTLLKKRVLQRFIKYLPSRLLYMLFIHDKYDCCIAFLEGMPCKVLAGAPETTKKFAWIHTDVRKYSLKERGFFSRKSENKCYSRFHNVICVSEEAKRAFIQTIIPEKPPVVIYNPIDSQEVERLALQTEGYQVTKKGFTLVSVGRFVSLKGFDRLITVFHRLREEGYEIYLWLVGEGEEEKNLRDLISKHKLEANVVLTGFQKNPYRLMYEGDLYVMSSRVEGYSLVVVEALTLGIPVMSTRCAGPVELLEEGKYGLLVDNSEKGIYEGLKKVFQDKKYYSMLKDQAQIRGKQLTPKISIEHLTSLLED